MHTNVIPTNKRRTHAQSNYTNTKLKAWFRRLLRHPARELSGPIVPPPATHTGINFINRQRKQYDCYLWNIFGNSYACKKRLGFVLWRHCLRALAANGAREMDINPYGQFSAKPKADICPPHGRTFPRRTFSLRNAKADTFPPAFKFEVDSRSYTALERDWAAVGLSQLRDGLGTLWRQRERERERESLVM